MDRTSKAPVCGLICRKCGFFENQCRGCAEEKGRPFWTWEIPGNVCPLYQCCREQRGLEHCGFCDCFPCELFLSLRDPNLSEDDFEKSLKERQDELNRRKEIGTDEWLQRYSGPS